MRGGTGVTERGCSAFLELLQTCQSGARGGTRIKTTRRRVSHSLSHAVRGDFTSSRSVWYAKGRTMTQIYLKIGKFSISMHLYRKGFFIRESSTCFYPGDCIIVDLSFFTLQFLIPEVFLGDVLLAGRHSHFYFYSEKFFAAWNWKDVR